MSAQESAQSAESADTQTLEWQAAGASLTAHVIDTSRPAPQRSGARSLCGRYPQRNDFPWFGLGVEHFEGRPLPYRLTRCDDCADRLYPPAATDGGAR